MNFRDIISRIQEVTGFHQKDVAREIFDISDNNLSNRIKRNSVDIDTIVRWAHDKSVNLNWLLMGEGEVYLNPAVVEEPAEDSDPELAELLAMTRRIVRSGTAYGHSLVANIRSFHQALLAEQRYQDIEARMQALERAAARNPADACAPSSRKTAHGDP